MNDPTSDQTSDSSAPPAEPVAPAAPQVPPQPRRRIRPDHAYAARRLAAALTPVAHLQRTPYSGPFRHMAIATADGVEIGATLLPRGRPDLLILCHGFGSSQRAVAVVWLAEALVGEWDVLTFDWRGYGRSSGEATLGGAEALDLAAVLAVAREMGYRRVGLVAESMGGLITLATLGAFTRDEITYPDRVAVIGAPGDYALTAGLRPQLVQYLAPQPWARNIAPLLGFRLGTAAPPRPLDVVNQIDPPLLIIHGDADKTVLVENAYRIHELVPGSILRIYEGVDHAVWAMRVQAPARLLGDLREFFREMSRR